MVARTRAALALFASDAGRDKPAPCGVFPRPRAKIRTGTVGATLVVARIRAAPALFASDAGRDKPVPLRGVPPAPYGVELNWRKYSATASES